MFVEWSEGIDGEWKKVRWHASSSRTHFPITASGVLVNPFWGNPRMWLFGTVASDPNSGLRQFLLFLFSSQTEELF